MNAYAIDTDDIQKNGIDEYKNDGEREKYFKRFDRIYGVHKGPFAAGEEVIY